VAAGGNRRRRLDVELVRRHMGASRSAAREAIEAGLVTVDGAPAMKPATLVMPADVLRLAAPPRRFVSRGGGKLAAGLVAFGVDPTGLRCLDAGISTGGFTHCLLEHGAAHVVGVDVGYGQVAETVRTDPRVEVRERTNVRDLSPGDLGPLFDLAVCDVSFIALRTVLPALLGQLVVDGRLVALVKPQFEAGRDRVGSGGVVRDPDTWGAVLHEVAAAVDALGWGVRSVVPSPLPGPAGNVEFLIDVRPGDGPDLGTEVGRAVADGLTLRDGQGT
jgi:23S rRNA (cytidine1920-2'-O)/16S rRNA (cytidine1409-2'-O)-methyltransferase